ncbi:MAG: hypothetical protein QXV61_03345 [Archaeoglobaceae archaeon]
MQFTDFMFLNSNKKFQFRKNVLKIVHFEIRHMRLAIMILLVILFIVPVSGKTEVYIKLDKDRVAIGESIQINVTVSCDLPCPIEILIKGFGGGEWLYENESPIQNFTKSWNFEIPEDWEEGVYIVKVNVIDNLTTREFFEQFRVIKPKILGIEFPELPYQGRTLINVTVETPDENKTSLTFKFIGLNFRFVSKEEFKPYKNSTKLKLNLREKFEETKDIDYALKPGIYAVEVFLKYGNKIFDSRIVTVEVVKPKLSVKVPDEVISGDPVHIMVSTNRVNEAFDGFYYNGIVLTLVGDNYKAVRIVELDENGQANITIETAGLSEGDYRLYIRDTGLTFRENDLKKFAMLYYDLDPKDSKAKEYYAQDDVLVVKDLKIIKAQQSKPKSVVFFEPTDQTVYQGDLVDYTILLSSAENGLSAYDMAVYVSNSSVAEFYSITLPDWAYETYKVVSGDYASFKVIDLKDGVSKGSSRVKLATIRIKTLAEGFVELTLKVNKLDSDNGVQINSYSYNAYLFVNPLPLEEIYEIDALINTSKEFESDILRVQELEDQYELIISDLVNYTSPEFVEVGNKDSEVSKENSPTLKPKEIGTGLNDIVLMVGIGTTFILILGRSRFSR